MYKRQEGGLSVLGTSGIVEPMSQQAILDTIQDVYKRQGLDRAAGRLRYCILGRSVVYFTSSE